MPPDTAAVRPGEELDAGALAAWLGEPVEIAQFPGGHSNLVYLIRTAAGEYVLRRPPLGPVAPKAHDMLREYRVLEAIHPHFPEAPGVFRMCEDSSVLGAPFFLMERRRGVILRYAPPPEWAAIPDYPRLVSEAFVDCLVRLHAVDISLPRVCSLGKPEGFVLRQVRGWADRWQRAKTEELAEMDRVIEWLAARIPPPLPPVIVHNDYKLDNVMLRSSPEAQGPPGAAPNTGGTHPSSGDSAAITCAGSLEAHRPGSAAPNNSETLPQPPRGARPSCAGSLEYVEAVLDWEMATLGDPLADLGLALCYWTWAGIAYDNAAITSQPGWFTRDEFVNRYAGKTGRDVTGVGYYEVLGIFKLAVILQQIYYRFHLGQTADQRFRDFDRRVRGLVRLAAHLVEQRLAGQLI